MEKWILLTVALIQAVTAGLTLADTLTKRKKKKRKRDR